MDLIRRLWVRIREASHGQTMAEYVLVVSAIAVVVYAGYQAFGTTVSAQVTHINGVL